MTKSDNEATLFFEYLPSKITGNVEELLNFNQRMMGNLRETSSKDEVWNHLVFMTFDHIQLFARAARMRNEMEKLQQQNETLQVTLSSTKKENEALKSRILALEKSLTQKTSK